MLTKFETKSNRVKGLAFHPKRPWILASLHSGSIQLWDYRVGTTIDRFEEHDGPVRGICFHKSQPLFVSGGDDYKIKVWNFKLKRCLFTLHGHLDYIRTVQFHDENPWIVSASDDQTIRIWNWQSRSCVSVLTGHNHYVMCAQFHMKEDLVVSASLDQTVRVWDISGLRKKSMSPATSGISGPSSEDVLRLPQSVGSDIFGGGDAIVKHVLEGHDRGVNWASFHPNLPLIVSGADDRQVKLWRYNESKAWEIETLRGHVNNVSCTIFHAKQDLIISNSEDRTIRVWDISKRAGVQTFRRENDRFWILVAHPDQNLLAAGHDSGMIVFKLERERPPYVVYRDSLYYVKDRYLRLYDFATQRDNPLISMKRTGTVGVNSACKSISYNPADNAILITSDADGGLFELYMLPKDASRGDSSPDAKTGIGSSAVFIARNRFAVLEKSYNQIQIRNLENEITKKIASPCPVTNSIFYAGTGALLCQAEDKIVLFNIQQKQIIAELTTPLIKYVVWSDDMNQVALLSKHAVIIATKKLQHICTLHEAMRVKSAVFEPNGVLIYTTMNHIKYCLPNGDTGIIKTQDVPLYLTKIIGSSLYCIDREGKPRKLEIDNSDYVFKLALVQGKYELVMSMIKKKELCGQAIIAYLQDKGFPEVALHFVKDERLRFNLAIECGNIEVALQSAQNLDDKDTWYRLGIEALKQGNHQIVEYSYQKTKSFERLSFLYVITGNTEKLMKMIKVSEMYDDVMGRFQNALFAGDIRERIKILEDSGQLALAYVTAKTHGLSDIEEKLRENLSDLPEITNEEEEKLMYPPIPILREANWPLLTIEKGLFDGAMSKTTGNKMSNQKLDNEIEVRKALNEQEIELGDEEDEFKDAKEDNEEEEEEEIEEEEEEEDGGWDMEDLDLPEVAAATSAIEAATGGSSIFVAPNPGPSVAQKWLQRCNLAAESASCGDFDAAMRLLNRQLGITDFKPLKKGMLELMRASQASLTCIPGMSPTIVYLENQWKSDMATCPPTAPAQIFNLNQMNEEIKKAHKLVTAGKFGDAIKTFTMILHTIPLLVVETRNEVDDVKEIINICKEYLIALIIETKRKELKDDLPRSAELAAYFTHCKLENVHLTLGLRSAMTIFFKLKNYATCAIFCRRLIELNPGQKLSQQAQQVLAACEKTPEDKVEINYDPRNPFDVCTLTFQPIYRGSKYVECPYTRARFVPGCKGQMSPIGKISTIGLDASGLICSKSQMK